MTHWIRDGSSIVGPLRKLGADVRAQGLWPPRDATPATTEEQRILNLKAAVDEAEPPAWVVSDRVHGDEHGVRAARVVVGAVDAGGHGAPSVLSAL